MIGNVQILKNSGESLMSNGLAHFQFNDSKKKYIIYSFGEQVNDYMKIHIGYEDAPVTDEGINSTDSEAITNLIKMIGKNEDISSLVTFLPLNSGLYHIHDKVKNILLPVQAFNNIISAQQKGQVRVSSSEEPVLQENKFFDSSSLTEPNQEVAPQQEESIFAKPLQPVIEPTNQNAAPVIDTPKETVVNNASQDLTSQNNLAVESTPVTNIENQEEITEEAAKMAIKAVEDAQETIKNNVELFKRFIDQRTNNKNLSTDSAQVSAPEYDVVKNMELAPQPEVPSDTLTSEPELTNDNTTVVATEPQVSVAPLEMSSSIPTSEPVLPDNTPVVPTEPQVSVAPLEMPSSIPTSEPALPSDTPVVPTEPQVSTSVPEVDASMSTVPQSAPVIDTSAPAVPESAPVIDTSAPVVPESAPVIDTSIPTSAPSNTELTSPQPQDYNVTPEVNANQYVTPVPGVVQDNTSTVNNPEPTGTIDYIDTMNMQNSASNDAATPGYIDVLPPNSANQTQPEIPVVSTPPVDNNSLVQINNIPETNANPVNNESFVIPQIDPSPSAIPQIPQAPVVMPDGQNQDVSQGLVLTPDAFNQAA